MYENIAIVAGSLLTATASFFIWQFLWPNPQIEVYEQTSIVAVDDQTE
jgi:hypothetical protein